VIGPLLWMFVLVALVGALMSALSTMLLVTPLVGLFVAVLMAIENVQVPGQLSARRVVVLAGSVGRCSFPSSPESCGWVSSEW
jgi:hypothetical protein